MAEARLKMARMAGTVYFIIVDIINNYYKKFLKIKKEIEKQEYEHNMVNTDKKEIYEVQESLEILIKE